MSSTSLTDATMRAGEFVPSYPGKLSCVSTHLSLVELRPSSDPSPPPEIGCADFCPGDFFFWFRNVFFLDRLLCTKLKNRAFDELQLPWVEPPAVYKVLNRPAFSFLVLYDVHCFAPDMCLSISKSIVRFPEDRVNVHRRLQEVSDSVFLFVDRLYFLFRLTLQCTVKMLHPFL